MAARQNTQFTKTPFSWLNILSIQYNMMMYSYWVYIIHIQIIEQILVDTECY